MILNTIPSLINIPAQINALGLFSENIFFLTCIDSFLLHWKIQLFDMVSTLKGKNLLLEEQILSFKSLPLLKREAKLAELLPL